MGRGCYLQSCAAHLIEQNPEGQQSSKGQLPTGRTYYLQSCAAHLIDDGQDSEGQADALLAAVLHQLKLTVRGHKADHLLGVEAPQVDTLVEGHILQVRRAGFRNADFFPMHSNCIRSCADRLEYWEDSPQGALKAKQGKGTCLRRFEMSSQTLPLSS